MQDDIDHLNRLGKWHYILGGLCIWIVCISIFQFFSNLEFANRFKHDWVLVETGTVSEDGVAIMSLQKKLYRQYRNEAIIDAVHVPLFGGLAICLFLSGRKLRQRKGRVFSKTIAWIECIFFPFGTILGVTTLDALKKESIKELYASTKDA